MKRPAKLLPVLALLTSLGCYHATITTGLAPSSQTIDQPWATSLIYGLVPPSTVETASKCPGGVAKVETQRSFLNSLVGGLTLGIYTPMAIKVTCAQGGRSAIPAGGSTIEVGANASTDATEQALARAVQLSEKSGVPVYVQF